MYPIFKVYYIICLYYLPKRLRFLSSKSRAYASYKYSYYYSILNLSIHLDKTLRFSMELEPKKSDLTNAVNKRAKREALQRTALRSTLTLFEGI